MTGQDSDFDSIERKAAKYTARGWEPVDTEPGEWLTLRDSETGEEITVTPDRIEA